MNSPTRLPAIQALTGKRAGWLKLTWPTLAGIFGILGYKLYVLGLGHDPVSIGLWSNDALRLTTAWPRFILVMCAFVCSVMTWIYSCEPRGIDEQPCTDVPPKDGSSDRPPIPVALLAAHSTWFRLGVHVQRWLVILGIVSVACSLAVTAFGHELRTVGDGLGTRLLAFVGTLSTGLLGTFGLVQKNRDIWTSWRRVQSAILRYTYDKNYTFADLMKTYDDAEKSLGNVVVTESPKSHRS